MSRRILVTAALPYANGHIHIGHLMEYVQTDIWVRFQKLRGHQCIYICADDTHGTPIMLRARREGRSETSLLAEMHESHLRDFTSFQVEFDNYGSTNSPESQQVCEQIWAAVRAAGLVVERDVEQLFDASEGIFLADRFVRGKCPKCGAPDQYGDNCDVCGHTYVATELIDPVSTISGETPEIRTTKQLFVRIEELHAFLDEWTQSGDHLQPEMANYLKGQFLSEELRDWDVSRPAPYFGFPIPDSPGNYWYVWFDAPIGYIGSTAQYAARHGQSLDEWWRSDDTEIHHFIGKDITYFHTLFWPAMLKTAGLSLPKKVHIHGFLKVNGRKMSKRDGTFVLASTFAGHLDPAAFRYYLASKLGPGVDDLDLNLKEFVAKVNSDLVGKVVNLASRSAKFVAATGLSANYPDDGGLFQKAAEQGAAIAEAYEKCDYNQAMRLIMELADAANAYVDRTAPWTLKKEPDKADELQDACTVALNLFRQIVVYLTPVMPRLAEQVGELLTVEIAHWDDAQTPLVGTPVAKFKHLMQRVTEESVEKMIEDQKQQAEQEAAAQQARDAAQAYNDSDQPLREEALAETCTIEDFMKVDLRVARVIQAEHVPEANKLLKLTLSLGGDEQRQVFAGIKAAYEPDKLVGRLVVMVANLEPRQMRFGLSEGMVTAAGPGKAEVYLLGVDSGAKPGQRVH
ncbi:MAG: methionine--tRNA ligase [Planctomycetales bacterium]|nr:methionine--tRNA ligase [Planctomycetales bacterium]